ncbi:MAG TPA: M48 family metalloprotease [Longimicrobiales bacterium]|nr:M48 family metalloprotease [Longimicrobiales bacterium]
MSRPLMTALPRRWALTLAPALLLPLGACATNPVTGERELALISESQEIQMGQQYKQQVEATLGLVDDAALQAYVDRVGQRLAAVSERPELPWSFGVVDDPTPNAFALPGGPIYITRGLMTLMDSEAELASVLGHEIGHITARHAVSQLSRAQLAQVGLIAGMILRPELQGLGGLASSGLQILFLKYGRDDERQADDLGYRYAGTLNYDVREMADVFAQLQRAGEMAGHSPLPSWLSSHPYPEERIARIQERLAQEDPALLDQTDAGRAAYMRQVDGLVYGENPRQGYFEDALFLHPDLRFRWQLPRGWKTQNMTQAVIAVSPQEDAMLELTLAPGGSATQAAQAFLSQQGLQVGQSGRTTVNGLPAYSALFQARTEQGVLTGQVVFIEYGGAVYRIMGYTPQARFSSYDDIFRSSLGSFAQLTDPAALAVQPKRLDIVEAPRAMTLADFQRQWPSSIPMEELALINQVSGADARIPMGAYVKRVTE